MSMRKIISWILSVFICIILLFGAWIWLIPANKLESFADKQGAIYEILCFYPLQAKVQFSTSSQSYTYNFSKCFHGDELPADTIVATRINGKIEVVQIQELQNTTDNISYRVVSVNDSSISGTAESTKILAVGQAEQ